jgi:type II secretory pathway predicted ATPase ExeA
MYEAFYGFKEKPFSMLPDPSFLFLSKKHRAALTLLEYGLMNQVGFCILSGEPGAGKTTILRALLNRVDDNVKVGLISNTHQSFGGLLDWILAAFDLHKANLSQVEMHQLFVDFLIDEFANNRRVLLIVDEAQNMDPDSLEELRMLSNVNTDKDQLLQVVLAGQPKLKENLRKPELMQFAQRIAVDYHLHTLNLNETCGYIQHRLVVAGAERDVFTPEACERIHCYSGGSPRLINLLCETALVYGFADEKELIDADLVEEMVHERMEDSVVPLVNCDGAKDESGKSSAQLVKDFPWIRPEGGTKGLKPTDKAALASVAEVGNQGDKPNTGEASDSVTALLKQRVSEQQTSGQQVSKQGVAEEQVVELETTVPADLISQAEVFGNAAVAQVVVEQANEDVIESQIEGRIESETAGLTEDITQVKAAHEGKQDTTESQNNSESAALDSINANDALAKEIRAKSQIDAAAPKKSSVLKYSVYAGIIALGLAIVALFFNDYTQNNQVFDEVDKRADKVQQGDLLKKENKILDKEDLTENKLKSQSGSSIDVKTDELLATKLEKEKLEKAALEEARLKKDKLEKDRLEKEQQAKLAEEKANKEIEQKQAAKKRKEQQRLEAKQLEANEKRKIAKQIRERETQLAAQEEMRRRQLEVKRVEKQKRELDARLAAVKKMEQEQEAKRLETEWLEKQRASVREVETSKVEKPPVDDGFVSKSKKKLPGNCVGPAAKFKSACR